jgi:hypothetical protein
MAEEKTQRSPMKENVAECQAPVRLRRKSLRLEQGKFNDRRGE